MGADIAIKFKGMSPKILDPRLAPIKSIDNKNNNYPLKYKLCKGDIISFADANNTRAGKYVIKEIELKDNNTGI